MIAVTLEALKNNDTSRRLSRYRHFDSAQSDRSFAPYGYYAQSDSSNSYLIRHFSFSKII